MFRAGIKTRGWVRRHHWLVIALGVGLAVVVVFVATLIIPLVREICTAAEHGQKLDCGQHHLGPFVLLWVILLVDAHNGFVTAVATIVMALFTGTLWFVTNKSVSLAQKEFKLAQDEYATTNRAYIVPRTFNYEISTQADGIRATISTPFGAGIAGAITKAELDVLYFSVQPVWVNAGNTPTAQMRIRVDWCDGDERPVGSYRPEQKWQHFFVAPKSSETSEFIEMPGLNALIQDGAVGISTPMPLRLIWGVAEYNDVFGKKHWLRWCYRIRPSRPVPGQGLKVSFIQWGDYNASSDEAD